VSAEAIVRRALRSSTLARDGGKHVAVDEFWLPGSGGRADLVVLGRYMDAFEIKTEHDSLRRLPAQAAAYQRLFDRCTAVVAEKHLAKAQVMLPDFWGISSISMNGHVSFISHRKAKLNRHVDPELLVRLLWRDEALAALMSVTGQAPGKTTRTALWRALVSTVSPLELKRIVRKALMERDPRKARIPTRRFACSPAAP